MYLCMHVCAYVCDSMHVYIYASTYCIYTSYKCSLFVYVVLHVCIHWMAGWMYLACLTTLF